MVGSNDFYLCILRNLGGLQLQKGRGLRRHREDAHLMIAKREAGRRLPFPYRTTPRETATAPKAQSAENKYIYK